MQDPNFIVLEEIRKKTGILNEEAKIQLDKFSQENEIGELSPYFGFYWSNRAEIAYYDRDFETLAKAFTLLDLTPNINFEYFANVAVLLSTHASGEGDLVFAMESYDKIIEKLQDKPPELIVGKQALGYAHCYRGTLYLDSGNSDAAESDFHAAHDIFTNMPGHFGITTSNGLLIAYYLSIGRTDKLRPYLEMTVNLVRVIFKDAIKPELKDVLDNLEILLQNSDIGTSEISKNWMELRNQIPQANISITDYYIQTLSVLSGLIHGKNFDLALNFARNTIKELENLGYTRFLPKIWFQIASIYEILGEFEKQAKSLLTAMKLEKEVGAAQAIQKANFNKMVKEAETAHKIAVIEKEKNEKIDELLKNTLPPSIVKELSETGKSVPLLCEATILVGDIVSFSTISNSHDTHEVFDSLNTIYSAFDEISGRFGLRRLKTIGDAYLIVCGLFEKIENPVDLLVRYAQECTRYLESHKENLFSSMRWGLAKGKVMAGIVGTTQFQYDVFGNTVNLAFRLESASQASHIAIPKELSEFVSKEKHITHSVDLKGVGMQEIFLYPLNQ